MDENISGQQVDELVADFIEQCLKKYISTDLPKNNMLSQNQGKSSAIVLETNDAFTYRTFWDMAAGKTGRDRFVFESTGTEAFRDKRSPRISWHAEKTGERNTEYLDNIVSPGYNAIVQKGENPICLTFGRLTWYVSKRSDSEGNCGEVIKIANGGNEAEFVKISTPLILVPVRMSTIGVNYWLSPIPADVNDAAVNPALLLRYQSEGLDLFDLPEGSQFIDLKTFDIEKYFDYLEKFFRASRGALNFTFDKNYVTLDKFDYDHICMYRDVLRHKGDIMKNKLIRAICGEPVSWLTHEQLAALSAMDNTSGAEILNGISPENSFQILDSDSSQCAVIERFRNGESFILEGPPGTGKTQTIVNMIADAIMRDKTVLFVSGKMSALRAVKKKLDLMSGVNISSHCLFVEGEEEAKKNNLQNIYGGLSASFNAPAPHLVRKDYEENKRMLLRSRELLEGYNREFYDANNSLKMSIYDIIGRMLLLGYKNDYIAVRFENEFIENLSSESLEARAEPIARIERVVKKLLARSGSIENDAWYGYKKFEITEADRNDLAARTGRGRSALGLVDAAFAGITADAEEELKDIIEAVKNYPLSALRAVSDGKLSARVNTLYMSSTLEDEEEAIEKEIEESASYASAVAGYYSIMDGVPAADPEELKIKLGEPGELEKCNLSELIAEHSRIEQAANEFAKVDKQYITRIDGLSAAELSALIDKANELISVNRERAALTEELLKDFDAEMLDCDYSELLVKLRTRWSANVKEGRAPMFFGGQIKQLKKYCHRVDGVDFGIKNVYAILEKLDKIKKSKMVCEALGEDLKQYGFAGFTDKSLAMLASLLKDFLAEKEALSVNNLISNNISILSYISGRKYRLAAISEVVSALGLKRDITLSKLRELVENMRVVVTQNARINSSGLSEILPELCDGCHTDWKNMLSVLRIIDKIRDVINDFRLSAQQSGAIFKQLMDALLSHNVYECIERLFREYTEFYANGEWFEQGAIAFHPYADMTFADFATWLAQVGDSDHISEYVEYKAECKALEGTPEGEFCSVFLRSGRERYPIDGMRNQFEISVLYAYYRKLIAATKCVSALSNNAINSVREVADKFNKADRAAMEFNRKLVDYKLYSRINRNTEKHNYLGVQSDSKNQSVRKLLKFRSESIIELTPCIMMSVQSVSKLLPYEKYRFDVVIFDEASQIPVEEAVTSILRTDKQLIIAGDPKQMPVIKYFQSEDDGDDKDTGDALRDEAYSTNSNALINFALKAKFSKLRWRNLLVHYRSNHESLIKFSNEHKGLYNGKLVTFPSPKPRTRDFGLWNYLMTDCRGSGGGRNPAEARKVAELIKQHFIKYPLPERDKIEQYSADHSLGVIVFGKHQAELLLDIMTKDPLLRKVAEYNDNRVFSITTADNTQGDEMAEIIISLTYGRNAEGEVSESWGHMNVLPVALYKFNVAVTRARDNLKFVHSVEAADIHSENLEYVATYLRQFNSDTENQFVSNVAYNTDFVSAVGKLCEEVVGADRVVYNFGENVRSYRIPISILTADRTEVALGIMCEENRAAQGFSIREYSRTCNSILKMHGWNNIYETYAIQWIRNYNVEHDRLVDLLRNLDK